VAWGILIDNQINNRQKMELYTMGWLPDYSDPENYILPIWDEDINGGDYYETDMHGPGGLYELMLTETDFAERDAIFQEIQQKWIERDYPGMLLMTSINWDAWNENVRGYETNSIGRKWCYPCYFAD
jgi:ABC-type transport system substrate-binding protein